MIFFQNFCLLMELFLFFSNLTKKFSHKALFYPITKQTVPCKSGVKHIDLSDSKYSNGATPEEPELCAQSPQLGCPLD